MISPWQLTLERQVSAPPSFIWQGWTDPKLLPKWFCPLPWKTTECEIDLRPGGIFRTVMQGPAGERQDNRGCYLEVLAEKRLVWTNALLPGFVPAPAAEGLGFVFTAIIELEPREGGTLYRATVLHRNQEERDVHSRMGFREGWNMALDQLLALG